MVLMWKTSVAQARGELVGFLLEAGQRMWQKRSKDAMRSSSTSPVHVQVMVNRLQQIQRLSLGEGARGHTGCFLKVPGFSYTAFGGIQNEE